jgi:hypothetical protein
MHAYEPASNQYIVVMCSLNVTRSCKAFAQGAFARCCSDLQWGMSVFGLEGGDGRGNVHECRYAWNCRQIAAKELCSFYADELCKI